SLGPRHAGNGLSRQKVVRRATDVTTHNRGGLLSVKFLFAALSPSPLRGARESLVWLIVVNQGVLVTAHWKQNNHLQTTSSQLSTGIVCFARTCRVWLYQNNFLPTAISECQTPI